MTCSRATPPFSGVMFRMFFPKRGVPTFFISGNTALIIRRRFASIGKERHCAGSGIKLRGCGCLKAYPERHSCLLWFSGSHLAAKIYNFARQRSGVGPPKRLEFGFPSRLQKKSRRPLTRKHGWAPRDVTRLRISNGQTTSMDNCYWVCVVLWSRVSFWIPCKHTNKQTNKQASKQTQTHTHTHRKPVLCWFPGKNTKQQRTNTVSTYFSSQTVCIPVLDLDTLGSRPSGINGALLGTCQPCLKWFEPDFGLC